MSVRTTASVTASSDADPFPDDGVAFAPRASEITIFVVIAARASRAWPRSGDFAGRSRFAAVQIALRVVSRDLATIHTRATRVSIRGLAIPTYDAHTRLKFEAFKPEYLFVEREMLPAKDPRPIPILVRV